MMALALRQRNHYYVICIPSCVCVCYEYASIKLFSHKASINAENISVGSRFISLLLIEMQQ